MTSIAILGGGIATILLWIILCGLTAALAEKKGHKGIGYLLLSIFFSPLIGLLVVAAISNKNQKACPYCWKPIDVRATVCSYCCKDLPNNHIAAKSAEKEKWLSERIVELISSGKNATDAKIQAEAEYSVNKHKSPEPETTNEQ